MTAEKKQPEQPEKRHPVAHQVHHYPVKQADGSERHQLVLVTHVDDEGRARGVPVGWADAQAEFAPGMLDADE